MHHIVALSGGKDSVAMALLLAEKEPRDYTYLCTPTGDELPEMVDHWIKLGKILGKPILPVTSGRSLAGIITAENILPNWRMRWCTRRLKIEPFERYIMAHRPCTAYVGIRADEVEDREGVEYGDLASDVQRDFALVRFGVGIAGVYETLNRYGICIPDRTDCGSCFFQTLWEWYQLWLKYPDRYTMYEGWEAATGHTLRSEQRDTWPAGLRDLRMEFQRGRLPKQRRVMQDRRAMCTVCSR